MFIFTPNQIHRTISISTVVGTGRDLSNNDNDDRDGTGRDLSLHRISPVIFTDNYAALTKPDVIITDR